MLSETTPSLEPTGISVVPEPNPLTVLQSENLQLKETIENLTAQCECHQTSIIRLERDKSEILERLKAHEENQFTMVLANLENGDVAHAASEQINALSELVEERQEAGKITLSITLKPFREGAQTAVGEIKVTDPKEEKKPSVFFCENGKLTRQSQKQDNFTF